MLILEDLYLGDVRPSERSFKRNSQYAKALDEVVRAGDALTDTLTEKQKELFEDYMTAQREVNVLTDCDLRPGVEFCVSGIRQSQEWRCRNRAESGLNALLTSAPEAQDGMHASA